MPTRLCLPVCIVTSFLLGVLSGGCPPAETPADQLPPGEYTRPPDPINVGNNPLPQPGETIPPGFDATDTDGDGLSDHEEQELGTSVNSADTDGDGRSDQDELRMGLDPTFAEPTDTIDRVYCDRLILLQERGVWYTWSNWTDWYMGWAIGDMVVLDPLTADEINLFNISRETVTATLSVPLGDAGTEGTLTALDLDPVDPNDPNSALDAWVEVDAQRWLLEPMTGSDAQFWEVGDDVLLTTPNGETSEPPFLVNLPRCDYIRVRPDTGG